MELLQKDKLAVMITLIIAIGMNVFALGYTIFHEIVVPFVLAESTLYVMLACSLFAMSVAVVALYGLLINKW